MTCNNVAYLQPRDPDRRLHHRRRRDHDRRTILLLLLQPPLRGTKMLYLNCRPDSIYCCGMVRSLIITLREAM